MLFHECDRHYLYQSKYNNLLSRGLTEMHQLVTRVVCFSRSIERKLSLFANICLFIDDENSVTISETREYLVLAISSYLFAIFRVNLAFSASVFAIL